MEKGEGGDRRVQRGSAKGVQRGLCLREGPE
jgi:hypothetical protein